MDMALRLPNPIYLARKYVNIRVSALTLWKRGGGSGG